MWSIIFSIFSIIAQILLVILIFLLCLILLVLFYPIHYKAVGHKNEEDTKLSVKASWLFGFIRFAFQYPEPAKPIIKVLFFNILKSDKRSKKEASISDNEEQTTDTEASVSDQIENESTADSEDESNNNSSNEDTVNSDTANNSIEEKKEDVSESVEDIPEISTDTSESSGESEDFFQRITNKIQYTFQKVYVKIESIVEKVRHVYNNISYYAEVLRDDNTIALWQNAKKRLLKILRSIRPHKLQADIQFGTGAPDSTGYIYAAYAVCSNFLGKNVFVSPDFDNKILEGSFKLSGNICIFVLLWNTLRLILDKKTRKLIKALKAGRKLNG